jgi:hypothetical protein
MESITKYWEANWCITMGEAYFLGIKIKDPAWYLIVYPVIFALIFGGLLIGIENNFIELTESLAALFSVVFAGIITLILRSELKDGKLY